MTARPCMGGFCPLRDRCRNHLAPTTRQEPAERLCEKGQEKAMFYVPIKEAA